MPSFVRYTRCLQCLLACELWALQQALHRLQLHFFLHFSVSMVYVNPQAVAVC